MLKQLLELVAHSETVQSAELARKLGVSTALVESMLETLAQRGYVRLAVPGGSAACERCPAHTACLHGTQGRIWAVSAKGQESVGIRPTHDDAG